MTLKRVKLFAIAIVILPVFALAIFKMNSVVVSARITDDEDVATTYKKQCAMCHKATAEKSFDATKENAVLEEVVLKGKKAEKPPNMPAYEEKGMTPEKAKLLVEYMKKLRTPAAE